MLGAGHAPPRRNVWLPGTRSEFVNWTTLDHNPACEPDVVFDLNMIARGVARLPFDPDQFHEIHAYETLEHYGELGDFRGFFREWREFWRILKPGGHFFGSCPEPHAAFADPGHTRAVTYAMLEHLTRGYYENLGKPGCHVTDYRQYINPYWWRMVGASPNKNTLVFSLQKELPQE
jgi:hypothetical protein